MRIKLAHPLTLHEIAEVVGGHVSPHGENKTIRFLSTDSREVIKGDLFFALKGENFDGETFIPDIVKKGAFHLSSNHRFYGIQTEDTGKAILDLARYYKTKFKKLIYTVGITGSVGKTTTKEFTKVILSKKYSVHCTYKNNNNNLGVPLTVFSMPKGTEILIVEMGMNSPGEISRSSLCVTPDISVILNVGTAHIGKLGSREKIAEAKLEIKDGMNGGELVIPYAEKLLEREDALTFAMNNSNATFCLSDADGMSLFCRKDFFTKAPFKFKDKHLKECLAAAASIGYLTGLSPTALRNGISAISEENLRQKIIRAEDFFFLSDCYNASPESVKAALDSLVALPSYQRKSVLIGDILELGDKSEAIHKDLGKMLAKYNFYNLYLFGVFSKNISKGLLEEGFPESRIHLNDQTDRYDITAKQIRENHTRGEIILIKASRGMKLERILDEFDTENNCI